MKKGLAIGLFVMVLVLAGCENPELVTCQNEKQALQEEKQGIEGDLKQAQQTIEKQSKDLAELQKDYEEVNQKALEILLKYNAEDVYGIRAIKRYLQSSGCLSQY